MVVTISKLEAVGFDAASTTSIPRFRVSAFPPLRFQNPGYNDNKTNNINNRKERM